MAERAIGLGVLDFCKALDGRPREKAIAASLDAVAEVERLGYRRYWVTEHHDPMSIQGSPATMVALLAARSRRIKIGTGCVLARYHAPLRVAEDFRALAELHPGRIELGLGRGGPKGDLAEAIAGGSYLEPQSPDYHRRLTDTMRALRRGASPSVWIMGVGPESLGLAARHGAGVGYSVYLSGILPNAAPMIQAGYRARFRPSAQLRRPRVVVAAHVICAQDERDAIRAAAPCVEARYAPNLIGSAEKVVGWLRQLAAHYGTSEILIQSVVDDLDARLTSYELIAREWRRTEARA